MAVTSQEIEMLGCDVEGCEIEAPAVGGKIPTKFHSGTVSPGHLDAEPRPWVACRETHIAKAVIAVEKRALAEQAPAPEAAETKPEDAEPTRGDGDDDGERRRAEEAELEALRA
jgi:hypothetical protein